MPSDSFHCIEWWEEAGEGVGELFASVVDGAEDFCKPRTESDISSIPL